MGTRYESVTCEPFRAWNRLEPRPRKQEFDQAIRAEVHDPVWMLARQWQFGEFKGEDTGSAIFAKIQIERTQLKHLQAGRSPGGIVAFDLDQPLEKMVESREFDLGFKGRVRAGSQFLKLLDLHLASIPAPNRQQYRDKLTERYPIRAVEQDDADPADMKVQKANLLANSRLNQFLAVFEKRSVDGLSLFNDLKHQQDETLNSLIVHPTDRAKLLLCVADYLAWFESRFHTAPGSKPDFWNHQQLEYQVACTLPEKDGDPTLLVADAYSSGRLDWFSFDVERKPEAYAELIAATSAGDDVQQETFTFIPTEARFGGMPSNRWWEFEDGKVDLGNISAETTDIAKLVTAEYALIYGNDWFVVPYKLPIGSLSKINGLLVTDVFGQQTLINAATQGESDDWTSWGFFNLSVKAHSAAQAEKCDTRLFLPPAVIKVHESDAVEEVLLLRDEMANMVWGIETAVNDLLHRGADGHSLAQEKKTILHGEAEPPLEAAAEALLKYTLSNEVPENWIPFVPVHIGHDNRAVQLQRASMPRPMDGTFLSIRPRTTLLRFGFAHDPAKEVSPHVFADADKQLKPYFINEEEVLRSGTLISAKLQRSRWMNGKIVNWYGNAKQLGRGEGSSGLQFDKMTLLKKNR